MLHTMGIRLVQESAAERLAGPATNPEFVEDLSGDR